MYLKLLCIEFCYNMIFFLLWFLKRFFLCRECWVMICEVFFGNFLYIRLIYWDCLMIIILDLLLICFCYLKFVVFSFCIFVDVLLLVLFCFLMCWELVFWIFVLILYIYRCYVLILFWYLFYIINFDLIGDLCFCRKVFFIEWYRMV